MRFPLQHCRLFFTLDRALSHAVNRAVSIGLVCLLCYPCCTSHAEDNTDGTAGARLKQHEELPCRGSRKIPRVPAIDGPWWQVAYSPALPEIGSAPGQVVDHCFFKAKSGKWQLWTQIRGTAVGRLFYRWEGGTDFERPDWEPKGICWRADRDYGESFGTGEQEFIHAPFVFQQANKYVMYYGGGPSSTPGHCQMNVATSPDGLCFSRHRNSSGRSEIFAGPGWARDPMVLRVGKEYFQYYCGDEDGEGVIALRTSTAAVGRPWSEHRVVSRGGILGTGRASQQCPFVVYLDGYFYLFKMAGSNEFRTAVYRSEDPRDFGVEDDQLVAMLESSASEIIRVKDQFYISSLIPGYRGVRVARLRWDPPLKATGGNRGERPATHFTFEKRGKLLACPTDMPKPGPYYTCLVKMDGIECFPHEYALYFSTDHDRGKGGIWLYVCSGIPADAANWKSYDRAVADSEFDYLPEKPAGNPIFVDTVQGRQTETPHVNIIDGAAYMTYHNLGAGHGQSTLLATSKDGVNFARINGDRDSVILDYDPKQEVGNGHTGYFRWRPNPFAGVDYRFVGYSLHGGGDDFQGAMWGSNDAIHWDKLQIFDAIEGYAVEGDRIVRRRTIDPNSITDLGDGEYAAICSIGNRSSGGRPRVLELYEIYLADNGKTLTRESRKILGNGPSGAWDAEELGTATTVVLGDTWHMIYVGTRGRAGENTVMGAVGRLDKSAPRSPRLPPEERSRDFHNK